MIDCIVRYYDSQGLLIEAQRHVLDGTAEVMEHINRGSRDPRCVRVVVDLALPPQRVPTEFVDCYTQAVRRGYETQF